MDTLTPEKRSWNMSLVRSKNTKPERFVRSFLYRIGYRFRLHVKKLPGTPDIVLSKYKIIVDVRGCFWHQHKDCRYAKIPETRRDWWKIKLAGNIKRDEQNSILLINAGWHILIVWGCFLNNPAHTDKQKTDYIQKALECFLSNKAQLIELSENGNPLLMEANQNGRNN